MVVWSRWTTPMLPHRQRSAISSQERLRRRSSMVQVSTHLMSQTCLAVHQQSATVDLMVICGRQRSSHLLPVRLRFTTLVKPRLHCRHRLHKRFHHATCWVPDLIQAESISRPIRQCRSGLSSPPSLVTMQQANRCTTSRTMARQTPLFTMHLALQLRRLHRSS